MTDPLGDISVRRIDAHDARLLLDDALQISEIGVDVIVQIDVVIGAVEGIFDLRSVGIVVLDLDLCGILVFVVVKAAEEGAVEGSFVEGDINGDGKIDVSDYIGVANIILSGSIYGSQQ